MSCSNSGPGFILILGSQRDIQKGLALTLGWTACLVVEIAAVILVTGGKPLRPHTAPSVAAVMVQALLGALLIWAGFLVREVPYRGLRVTGVRVTDETVRFSLKTKNRRRRKTT